MKDEAELEEEYEKKILKEFEKIVNEFQKKHKMEETSIIRLLCEQITESTNRIDVKAIHSKLYSLVNEE